MRLLVLTRSLDGGIYTFFQNFLDIRKAFDKSKLPLKVLVLRKSSYPRVTDSTFTFFQENHYPLEKNAVSFKNARNFASELLWVKRRIEIFRPTILLAVDTGCSIMVQLLKISSFPTLKTILTHQIDVERTLAQKSLVLQYLLTFFAKHLYRRADAIICSSNGIAKSLRRLYGLRNVLTIYNGATYRPPKHPRLVRNERAIVLTVGRLSDQKDHATLIRAFRHVQKVLPKSELWITSDGPKRQSLRALVKTLGLSSNVCFFGWVQSVIPYLRVSDVFVLATKMEGFSYALLEAISQAKPVVSTDTPWGPSELLGNGRYGLLVPEGDEHSMKNALLKLLSDENAYHHYAKMALARSSFFSREKMLRQYRKLLLSLSL